MLINECLMAIPATDPLSDNIVHGTAVIVYQTDHTQFYCIIILWKHCKWVVPAPEVLYPMVAKVLHSYGSLKDAKTGQPMFIKSAWKSAKNILTLIKSGYLPDPPGIALYYQIGLDSKNGVHPFIGACVVPIWQKEGYMNKYALGCQYQVFHLNICIHVFLILC